MANKKTRGAWYLVLTGAVALALTLILMAGQSSGSTLGQIVRGTALLGYMALFLSIISSAYMKQLFRLFGRPFIQVHHAVSVTGLVMIALHPLSLAIDAADIGVFVPKFDSLDLFLTLGGRPALYLVGVAALAAVLRKTLGQNWRLIHILNYIAFWLITVHAIKIGTDFQSDLVQVIAILMALIVLATFVQKRVAQRRHKIS